jgi:CRP-like cAMP-binding protein
VLDYMMWVCGRFMAQDSIARKGLLGSESMNDVAAAMRSAHAAALNPARVAEFTKMLADQRRPAVETDTQLFSSLAEETSIAAARAPS